jgi:uncharacterized membrane-anchored protein
MSDFLASLLAKWRAIPLNRRAIGLALLSTIFLFGMIGVEQMRRTIGDEIVLHTRPVDPRDLMRGDYVALDYEIERVRLPDLPTAADAASWRKNDDLFLALRKDEFGGWRAYSLTREKPARQDGEIILRATYVRSEGFIDEQKTPSDVLLDIGADRYFSDKQGAKALEKLAREQGPLDVILSVGADGKAVLKGLVIDGQKRYETLF